MPDPTPTQPPQLPPSGRNRLRDALRRPHSRTQGVVGVILCVVGFAAVVQVRANHADDTYSGYREQALIDVLNGLAGASQRAQSEIARLEDTRNRLQSDTDNEQAALDQARKETETLQILAGVVPVTGPGIRITLTEHTGQVDIDSMLDLVEEMRTAFAESIQINGKARVVAQTSFEQGVGGLLVDGQLLEPPYVVDVIGEPNELHGGLTFAGGPISQLEDDGATVSVQELQSLDIQSVVSSPRPVFAEPGSGQ